MTNSEQDPSFEAGDLSADFGLGFECALPHLTAETTYLVVGRGKLPEPIPGVTYVRTTFDPTAMRKLDRT